VKVQLSPYGNDAKPDALEYDGRLTLICFSHLRWDFVFQRPQHLMAGFAKNHRVFFWEEPIYSEGLGEPRLYSRTCAG
jgi:UDP-galactopyranose mutase